MQMDLFHLSGRKALVTGAGSKGSIGQLTKALANEWASLGINVIAPGGAIIPVDGGFLSR
jgi:hypothetical protein